MKSKYIKHKEELKHQYLIFMSAIIIVKLLAWNFFSILVYQITDNLAEVVLIQLIHYISLWVGIIITSFSIDRFGYLVFYRLSTLLGAFTLFLAVLLFENLEPYLVLISLLQGLMGGFFWPVIHNTLQKDIHGLQRSSIISIRSSLELIYNFLIPVLSGALIVYTNSYQLSFGLGATILLVAAFTPFKYNKKGKSGIHSYEVTRILNHKKFSQYALLVLLMGGFFTLQTQLFSIVPFLILESELAVGALASFSGLLTAIIIFKQRKMKFSHKIITALIMRYIDITVKVVLAILWNPIGLIIKSTTMSIFNPYFQNATSELHYRSREKLLGGFNNQSTTEMVLIVETIYFLSRVLCLGGFYLILVQFQVEQLESIVILAIPITSTVLAITFHFFKNFEKKFRIH